MTMLELVDDVAETTGIQNDDVRLILEALCDTVIRELSNGEMVPIKGFGTFYPRKTIRRKVTDFYRNRQMIAEPHYMPGFRPYRNFVEAVRRPVEE